MEHTNSIQPNTWEVPWIPSLGSEALSCEWCRFLGLPKTLRLHQLLGCCRKTSSVRNSVQSLKQYQESHLPKALQSCSVNLKNFPVGSGMESWAPSVDYNAAILNVDNSGLLDTQNSLDFKFIGQNTEFDEEKHIKNEKYDRLGILKEKTSKLKRANLTTHTEERSVICKICGCKCTSMSTLKRHNLTHSEEKPFNCKLCSFKSSRLCTLTTHQLIHTGEKSFSCKICNYKCNKLSNLKCHNLTHTGEKPICCKICSYKCTQLSHLKSHILTHTGEKRYGCDVCSFKCSQLYTLKRHKLRHTGEKRFSCTVCSYKCSRPSSLKAHSLRHTGDMPFSCNMCSYRCKQARYLKSHYLIHSGEKNVVSENHLSVEKIP